jgi:hypothetical protein
VDEAGEESDSFVESVNLGSVSKMKEALKGFVTNEKDGSDAEAEAEAEEEDDDNDEIITGGRKRLFKNRSELLKKQEHRRIIKQIEDTKRKREDQLKKKKLARHFMEEEAELGSDNEENDDKRKFINRNDEDEIEAGMDKDLEGLIAKDEEIEDGDEEEMMQRYFLDKNMDDKQ